MERMNESENFQPRMVASFDRRQLIGVLAWGRKNNVTGKEALDSVLEIVGVDEEGNIMDETSRKRLRYGVAVLTGLIETKQKLNEVIGQVQVWQQTPGENDLEIRFMTGPRGSQN